jgi:hypothetical protein
VAATNISSDFLRCRHTPAFILPDLQGEEETVKKIVLGVSAALFLVACGGGQSAECKKYLACTEAVSPGSSSTLESSYGPNGACWSNGGQAADLCTSACTAALASAKTQNPTVTACQ